MSADEFDPMVERLFATPPHLPDAPLFSAQLDARLERGARTRGVVLTLAGLIGGLVAVRETMRFGFSAENSQAAEALHGATTAAAGAQASLQGFVDGIGLGSVELGSMGGMQLFFVAAAALVAVAAAGIVRLTQDV